MNHAEAVAYIHSRKRFPSNGSLVRMAPFLDALGHPERQLSFVHIAGTNGKGSTATMLSRALTLSGKKTGLFISPFVLDFRERIQIDGKPIPKDRLAKIVTDLLPLMEEQEKQGHELAEFELDTVIALLYYLEEKCDVVVLEAGVGGRYDATNCIGKPLLSILTGIAYDHTKTLGSTLTEIASNKADIIKGNDAVLYPVQDPEALAAVMKRCAEVGSKLMTPALSAISIQKETLSGTDFLYGGEKFTVRLLGTHQVYNAVTVIEAARALSLADDVISKALETVTFPARMEVVSQDPLLVIDGAHNFHGMTALFASVKKLLPPRYAVILGIMEDKDYKDAVLLAAKNAARVCTVTVDNYRAMTAEHLKELADTVCGDVIACQSYDEALKRAKEIGCVLVCGSLYLASDIRNKIIPFTD